MERVVDHIPPEQRKYLEQMLDNNVFFYPQHLWDKAVEVEILDRGLVRKNDTEHLAILELVAERKEA